MVLEDSTSRVMVLSGEGLNENLHASTETQDEIEGGLLLGVVIREGAVHPHKLLSCVR